VNQINGEYETKEEEMKRYLGVAKRTMGLFEQVQIL